tara:strand:- start:80 stop:922 length:843 start_codon:yes stop_codon:yes gene_type:complete
MADKSNTEVLEAEVVEEKVDTKKQENNLKKTSNSSTKKTDTKAGEESPWYVFCSQGCGFCKKAEPHIEALQEEGYDLLKLDVAEGDNQKLSQELQQEFGVKCGTPWFINADTGKGVCGYREKDVLKKWLDGEDIPEPPRPKGPMPRVPLLGVSNKEELEWKKEYKKWSKENSHLPNLQTADQILSRPRPKTEPPAPPNPQMTNEQLDEWGEKYDTWFKENSHLPNLQPVDVILQRLKRQKSMTGVGQGQNAPAVGGNVQQQLNSLEQKVDKLLNHLGVTL